MHYNHNSQQNKHCSRTIHLALESLTPWEFFTWKFQRNIEWLTIWWLHTFYFICLRRHVINTFAASRSLCIFCIGAFHFCSALTFDAQMNVSVRSLGVCNLHSFRANASVPHLHSLSHIRAYGEVTGANITRLMSAANFWFHRTKSFAGTVIYYARVYVIL